MSIIKLEEKVGMLKELVSKIMFQFKSLLHYQETTFKGCATVSVLDKLPVARYTRELTCSSDSFRSKN